MEIIDNKLIGELLAKAGASARLRRDLDLRTSGARRLDEHISRSSMQNLELRILVMHPEQQLRR